MKQAGDKKIKVLHVVGRMDRGGTETLIMNLLRVLDRKKFQYDIVEQTLDICDYDEEIESLGSIIYRCPTISITNLISYRQWWKKFFKEHPEYRIVHGHSRGSAPIYLDEAKKAGCIAIAHCHNNSYGLGIKGLIRKIWQLPLKTIADYNFACSNEAGISQYGRDSEFTVIKNGIPAKEFRYNPETRNRLRKQMGLEDCFVVGNVARFEEQKNHILLLKIFNEIVKIKPNAKLLLVGNGSLEKKIEKKVNEYSLKEKVIFAGICTNVNELLQAMDVFLLPSLFEGLGIVNIEAQASGLPCFVSDTVSLDAKITDLMHYLPLKSSADIWAKQIVNLYDSFQDRRDTFDDIVSSGYDINTTSEWLQDFYLTLSK